LTTWCIPIKLGLIKSHGFLHGHYVHIYGLLGIEYSGSTFSQNRSTLFTSRQGVTYQKTWIFNNTAVRI